MKADELADEITRVLNGEWKLTQEQQSLALELAPAVSDAAATVLRASGYPEPDALGWDLLSKMTSRMVIGALIDPGMTAETLRAAAPSIGAQAVVEVFGPPAKGGN